MMELEKYEETKPVIDRIKKGIPEFMQIYTLKDANVSRIFAGGRHSFFILNNY